MASHLDLTFDLHCDKQQATSIYSDQQIKDSSVQNLNSKFYSKVKLIL